MINSFDICRNKTMKKIKAFLKLLMSSFNYTYHYNINDKKQIGMKLYQSKSEVSEKWMGDILKRLLNMTDELFIDVGVNLGQTLCQVKSLDIKREYIGFEPNYACNMFVEEIIRLNKFQNTKVIPVGLFRNNSILELDLYHNEITNAGGSLITDYWEFNKIRPMRKLMVPVMSFQTICDSIKIEKIGILKIDVEGAELEVFQSMLFRIETDRPLIIVEIISAFSEENKLRMDRQTKILEIFDSLNYLKYRILRDKSENLVGISQIENIDPEFDHNQCNYLFIPKEKEVQFSSEFKDCLIN